MRFVDRIIAGFLPVVPKAVVGRVSQRNIAGETMADAIRVARNLNAQGFCPTMDILGEDVHHLDQAREAAENYRKLLDELHREKIDSNVSVKLTQLGLKVDKQECLALADSVVSRAHEHRNFVRIDMEDSSCTSDTLGIYAELHRHHQNVGVVIQAYLHRTMDDVSRLLDTKPNFRLCKGVYVEPEAIAYKERSNIND